MSRTRKQACLDALRSRILTQALAPGADLDETAISAEYELSRTPLREVFQRLAGEGYLRIEENRGATVASMNVAVMRTFFQTAPLIYSSVARLAAENRTAGQIDALKSTQSAFAEAVAAARPHDMALCNHRFHEEIGEMAANDYLTPSLKRLLIDHTRLAQMFYRPASPAERTAVKTACDQHDAMIAAIEARDADAVVDLTLRHWELSRDRMARFVRPDPLPLDVGDMKEAQNAL